MSNFELKPEPLTLENVQEALQHKISISESAKQKIQQNRAFLEQSIAEPGRVIYGVNTGFGSLCNTVIPNNQLEKLQENLVISHACGVGAEINSELVKIMLLLKIQNMTYGFSGVRLKLVEKLIELYNNDVLPVIYESGSLGASGDLAPLAHLSLPLLGLGEVNYLGKKYASLEILNQLGIEPISLQAKEGLALLNGTQFMSAHAVFILLKTKNLLSWANKLAAVSFESFDGHPSAFFHRAHEVRKQSHQLKVANEILSFLEGSEIITQPKQHVQDPYSFRCVPQVHGASWQWIDFITQIVENEISSVTDNPIVFEEENRLISAGNFHGQPLALALDSLAIALAEFGSISERRVYKLISGQRGLPAFLTPNPGINSGFMIAQYSAASLVSKNKQLCTPASVDTIDSSNGQEDHVSMGANAATKCLQVLQNLEDIFSIELVTAFQALDFRKNLKSSEKVESLRVKVRESIPFLHEDVYMAPLFQKAKHILNNN